MLVVISMLKINRKLSKKGFTLIEVIVVIGILGIASLGIFQSYRAGFWGMSDAKMRTIATNIAREKLEEVKGKTLDAGTYPDPDNPIVVSGKDFNATVDVVEVSTTLKKIITTVSWQKRNGDTTQISIESLQNMAPASPSDDVATAILVSANPSSINVGDTSQIKVTILDQDNYPISFNGQVDLSLIPSSPVLGTLTDNSLTFTGESYLYTTFTSTDAGEVNVKGESTGLISDSDTITITGGAPVKINLVVDPTSVLINGETSTLTVRIEDDNDYLADSWTGTVQLSITSGQATGDLGDPPSGDTITIDFVNENLKTTLFTSSTVAGEAVIEATDQAGVLTADTETIYVSSGPPTKIDIKANPKNIFIAGYEDGPTSSTVTVTIKNATDVPTSGFVGTVTLSILSGEGSGALENTVLSFNGESELSTTFNSSTDAGMVEIEAEDTTGGPGYTPLTPDTETITVAEGPPDHLEMIAVPDIILNNGLDSSTLNINVVDFAGNRTAFTDSDKTITFTLSPNEGTVNDAPLTLPVGESQLITTYFCDNPLFEGDVIITAHCEGIDDASDTVQVGSRIIRPAEDPDIRYGRYTWLPWITDRRKVLFDIVVMGGTIEITQIDLAWKEPPVSEDLRRITIYEKDNSSNRKIRKTWYSWNDPQIPIYPSFYEITSFDQNEDLVEGDYTVELSYDRIINDRTIIIRFHGRYEGRDYIYQLEFLSPDQIV